jgi:hypothetical protein
MRRDVLDILTLQATTYHDQLASELVVQLILFRRVRVCVGLLGETVESISSGEIGTRHLTGKQGAVAVVAADQRPAGNLE